MSDQSPIDNIIQEAISWGLGLASQNTKVFIFVAILITGAILWLSPMLKYLKTFLELLGIMGNNSGFKEWEQRYASAVSMLSNAQAKARDDAFFRKAPHKELRALRDQLNEAYFDNVLYAFVELAEASESCSIWKRIALMEQVIFPFLHISEGFFAITNDARFLNAGSVPVGMINVSVKRIERFVKKCSWPFSPNRRIATGLLESFMAHTYSSTPVPAP
jgi:hypothetical protein